MSKNKIALITGATSGIGAAFAKKLAAQCYDLIIVGRRKDKLNALAQELGSKYSINVEIMFAELSEDKDLKMLVSKIKNLSNLSILINNAGFGLMVDFIDGDITDYERIAQVHMMATMKFTHAALQNMKLKNAGTIINVSSIGAYLPFPQSSVYVATKAFISLLTETISAELADTDIRIQVLCPGMTKTEFFARMGKTPYKIANEFKELQPFMSAEEVVDTSFKYLQANKTVCIPGEHNQQFVFQQTLKRLGNNENL